jgi:hypothetical protein
MRMSFSRLAAVGAVLAAGVTLASCASSASPIAASGPNPAAVGFPGGSARVHFIQGSPQLNLLVNNTDMYIDNKLAFTNFTYPFAAPNPALSGPTVVGPVTPYIELPIGQHDIRLVQHGTTNPTFLELVFTFKANTKYAIIAQGDAGDSSTGFGVFVEPSYNTAAGNAAVSVFNASPRMGVVNTVLAVAIAAPGLQAATPAAMRGIIVGKTLTIDTGVNTENVVVTAVTPTTFTANFTLAHAAGASITAPGGADFRANGLNLNTDTIVGLNVADGTPTGALISSWKTNVFLPPSPSDCISAYIAGTTTPLVSGWPTPTSDEHLDLNCTGTLPNGTTQQNLNLYLIDFGVSPATTSIILPVFDQNG